ncbi:MAG: hypothetical protein H8E48_06870 [Chloroflexi bacterium]|nr:hypothetical protein [Chloroflexota bacterium]
MRFKKPYIATLDQVKISRDGDAGIIRYLEPGVHTTHLTIGPEVQTMTDQQVLDAHNDCLRAQEQLAAEYKHIAVELPPGSPQIKYFAAGDQWCPRGDIVRCVIEDDENAEAVIYIDDQKLSLQEFGRLLTTRAGWGMRVVFVPDDEIDQEPQVVVKEPMTRG